ncbi:CypX, Cytochrome P450, partial [Pyrenophora tritici-repentis]
MSNSQLYTGALVLLVIYLVISPIIRALMTPLRSVPGPFLARFTRLWELRAVRKHDFATYNIALHEEYGPVVRLAPNRYSVNDTGASRVLLGYHNALDKSNYYTPFGDPSQGNLFSEVNVQIHANIRRPISQLYSNNNLLSYEPFVNACNSILLRRLKEYSGSGKQLNVRHLMQYYAFDVIGEITLGSRFGFMEEDGDKAGLITAIDEGLDYGAKVGLIPEVHWALCKAAEYLGIKSPFMKVMDFILLQIQNRVSGQTISPKDRQDFLDKLLPLEKNGKATRLDTINACGSNIGAGSDTTAISLTATIAYLSMHPDVLAKLREELDDAVNRGAASDPITFKESQKLPYLRAVIQETLRMHPAVGAPLTRIIGIGGANLAGRYFPAGTEVGVNPWVIHNNKEIFGPDASKFRPERWLVQDAEKRAVMDRNFLTFGAGSRTCIGKNISLLEMYKVIPQIVKKFDFQVVAD